MLQANFSFFTFSAFYWSRDVRNPSLLLEGACNPLYVCHTLFKFAVLSKDQTGFPNETFMETFIDTAFPATTKICFSLVTFYFFSFIFAYLVDLTSLIHSHTEQCFYYKNYTSLLKTAFNIQISITNSFKKLKRK